MNGAMSRGTRIRLDDAEYTVDGVIAIDERTIVYAISGDGPARLFCSNNADESVNELIEDEDGVRFMDIEPFYHYIFNWETGEVVEKNAYGLVIHPNAYTKENRYILFSPYYLATLSENQLGGVTRDYQMITKDRDLSKAKEDIFNALKTRKRYFDNKAANYEEAINRLENLAF